MALTTALTVASSKGEIGAVDVTSEPPINLHLTSLERNVCPVWIGSLHLEAGLSRGPCRRSASSDPGRRARCPWSGRCGVWPRSDRLRRDEWTPSRRRLHGAARRPCRHPARGFLTPEGLTASGASRCAAPSHG